MVERSAIAALRSTFPQTHLELLGYPVVAELARSAGIIDAFRSIEARPLARFFARNATLDDEWSDFFDSFNVIVSYLYDPDEIFKTNIGRVSKAQFIQGQHRPDEQEPVHATTVFLKPLERFAIFEVDPVPTLRFDSPDSPSPPARRLLAVHPGSGSSKKNWPAAHWLDLLQQIIANSGWDILLVGGEAEAERVRELARVLPPGRVRASVNLPLSNLAVQLSGCAAFIGHDSGITHLASALGLPVLVLWGPSNETIWRPLGPRTHILRNGERLAELPAERVFEEWTRFIESPEAQPPA